MRKKKKTTIGNVRRIAVRRSAYEDCFMEVGAKCRAFLRSVKGFAKKNLVMVIALFAAVITMFIVPPDEQYLQYFDFKTLTCLFCVLSVVCALRNIRFFYVLARKVVRLFKNARMSVLALVYITFIGSMLIANDMALLTFLPLGFFVLSTTRKEKYMACTFIMQNIAANLGGMLTPFGNPQNLYLYSKFSIPNSEFVKIMAPPFAIAVTMITICCLIFVKPEPLAIDDEKIRLPALHTTLYLLLFALSIAIVFRGIPYWIGLIVVPLSLLYLDRKALLEVDYPLLFTFVFFFVFAGNMGRIEGVRQFFSGLLEKNTFLVSVISCQFISNVPTAVLLSQFTTDYPALLVGVNIGGVGTLIASLASLITFREYVKSNPGKSIRYVVEYTLFNAGFLVVLVGIMLLIFMLT